MLLPVMEDGIPWWRRNDGYSTSFSIPKLYMLKVQMSAQRKVALYHFWCPENKVQMIAQRNVAIFQLSTMFQKMIKQTILITYHNQKWNLTSRKILLWHLWHLYYQTNLILLCHGILMINQVITFNSINQNGPYKQMISLVITMNQKSIKMI